MYTAVRSDYLTLIDFVIELVDYNLFMSSGQVEARLVKMTLRQVDASQNLSTALHHKTVPSGVFKSRSYSRARNRLSHKKYSCNLQLQVTLDLLKKFLPINSFLGNQQEMLFVLSVFFFQLCYLRNTLHLPSFGLFQNGGRAREWGSVSDVREFVKACSKL